MSTTQTTQDAILSILIEEKQRSANYLFEQLRKYVDGVVSGQYCSEPGVIDAHMASVIMQTASAVLQAASKVDGLISLQYATKKED